MTTWIAWKKQGTHYTAQGWSEAHIARNEHKTLCAADIPKEGVRESVRVSKCSKCERLAGKRDDRIVIPALKDSKAPDSDEIANATAAYLAKGKTIAKQAYEPPSPEFYRVGYSDTPGSVKARTVRMEI